jgi:hypothetical protein
MRQAGLVLARCSTHGRQQLKPNRLVLLSLPTLSAIPVKVLADNLIDYGLMMLDELVSRHTRSLPQGAETCVSVKPFVPQLMVELMAPRIL